MQLLKSLGATIAVIVLLAVPTVVRASAYAYTDDYDFGGGADGGVPSAPLTLLGTKLWGTTWTGGANQSGVIFTWNEGGAGYHTEASFPAHSGIHPNSPLLYGLRVLGQSGLIHPALYGTTAAGGTYGKGTVFVYDLAWHVFQTVYSFTGGADGNNPTGSLVFYGGKVWGVTSGGGNGAGTVYWVNPLTGQQHVVHSFTYDGFDGVFPVGGLVLSNSAIYGPALYGATSNGGSLDNGTVFGYYPVQGQLGVRCTFSNQNGGAFRPSTGLVPLNGYLYGASRYSTYGFGAVYRCDPDDEDLIALHTFNQNFTEGEEPSGNVAIHNNVFYGTTRDGGPTWHDGTLYGVDLTAWTLTTLHEFAPTEGAYAPSGISYYANRLYGVTPGGGGGNGTAFSVDTFLSAGVRHHPVSGNRQMGLPGSPIRRIR